MSTEMSAFVEHIQELADDDDDVNAEGDNVLAAADLRASEKKLLFSCSRWKR